MHTSAAHTSAARPFSARTRSLPPREVATRLRAGLRCLAVTGSLVAGAGLGGFFLSWPLLTSTLGPTAYVFAAHPGTEAPRWRNAVVGHAAAIGIGVGALAVFGLWQAPSVSALGAPTLRQVAAAAVAAGATVLLLELANCHHAPAAATALLIATGLARPGRPLIGLVVGLAVVVAFGPLLGRWAPAAEPGRDR